MAAPLKGVGKQTNNKLRQSENGRQRQLVGMNVQPAAPQALQVLEKEAGLIENLARNVSKRGRDTRFSRNGGAPE